MGVEGWTLGLVGSPCGLRHSVPSPSGLLHWSRVSGCLSVRPRVAGRLLHHGVRGHRFILVLPSLPLVIRAVLSSPPFWPRGSSTVVVTLGQRPAGAPPPRPFRRTFRRCRLAAVAGSPRTQSSKSARIGATLARVCRTSFDSDCILPNIGRHWASFDNIRVAQAEPGHIWSDFGQSCIDLE